MHVVAFPMGRGLIPRDVLSEVPFVPGMIVSSAVSSPDPVSTLHPTPGIGSGKDFVLCWSGAGVRGSWTPPGSAQSPTRLQSCG